MITDAPHDKGNPSDPLTLIGGGKNSQNNPPSDKATGVKGRLSWLGLRPIMINGEGFYCLRQRDSLLRNPACELGGYLMYRVE